MKRLAILLPFLFLQAAGCDDDRPTGPAPVLTAAFTVGGTLQAGQPVRFDAAASADPGGGGLSYTWTFGDGAHGGTREIAHLYAQGGAFAVQLTVRDAQDRTASATQTVTIAPGPAATGTATLSGRVTLPDGTPLAGVAVAVAGTSVAAQTAADGTVTLPPVPAGVPLALRLARAGYADGLVRMEALANGSSYGWFQAALTPRTPAGTLASAQAGGTVAGPAGAQVVFPAAALVRADGSPATGAVDVAITPVDVVNAADAFPGPFAGVQANGASTPIASFGVMEIGVSQGGQPLQIAPGRTATLEIPIYTGGATLGQTIPLWSLDEALGMWVQEGSGTVVASAASPTGLALRGTVSHLSWWNADHPFDPFTPTIRCVTLDGNGNPVPLSVPCWVRVKQEDLTSPVSAPASPIAPGGSVTLQLFPNVAFRIYGFAQGGTLAGDVLVSGASGAVQQVDVVLSSVVPVPSVDVVIAGGDGAPTLATSGMGGAWTARAAPFDGPSGRGRALLRALGVWVAGGTGPGGAIATSADGLAWAPAPAASMFTSVTGLAWTSLEFVAVGDGPGGFTVATSPDGYAWTAEVVPSVPGLATALACNAERCLAAGTAGTLLTSDVGSGWPMTDVWTPLPSPLGAGTIHALAWNGSMWIAVGQDGNGPRIASSPDGVTWSADPSPLPGVRAVAWNGSMWMLGGDGAVATSAIGDQWTVHPVPALRVFGISWSPAGWVAVGEAVPGGGAVLTSTSGATWSVAPLPFATAARAVLATY